jgi:hypothetical protein
MHEQAYKPSLDTAKRSILPTLLSSPNHSQVQALDVGKMRPVSFIDTSSHGLFKDQYVLQLIDALTAFD